MPDMNTLQHIHSARSTQIQTKTETTDTDYEHINRKKQELPSEF